MLKCLTITCDFHVFLFVCMSMMKLQNANLIILRQTLYIICDVSFAFVIITCVSYYGLLTVKLTLNGLNSHSIPK